MHIPLCPRSTLACSDHPIDFCILTSPFNGHDIWCAHEATRFSYSSLRGSFVPLAKFLGQLAFRTAFTLAPETSCSLHTSSRHLKHDWETRSFSSHLRYSVLGGNQSILMFTGGLILTGGQTTSALRRLIRLVLDLGRFIQALMNKIYLHIGKDSEGPLP